jgi:hypothetical protein
LVALGLAASGCWFGDDPNAFCEQLVATRDAGPIFPARTDGRIEPDLEALDRLHALAATAPGEIADELEILVDDADDLVRSAQNPAERGSSSAGSGRWSRSVVESAQRAVFRYAADTCDIDLTRAPVPTSEGDVEAPPEVLPTD